MLPLGSSNNGDNQIMNIVHISEEEAVRDFAAVLARFDAGEEVIIDRAISSVRLSNHPTALTIGEVLKRFSESSGPHGVMDEEFAADVQEAMNRLRAVQPSPWD